MVTAGEIVAEFVNEQNAQQSEREGQARDKREWMFVEKREGVQKFVEIDGLVFRVGCGEMRAGYEAGTERSEKKQNREQQSFQRRVCGNRGVIRRGRKVRLNRLPVGLSGFDRDA